MARDVVPYALEEGDSRQAAEVQAWGWKLDGDDWVKTGLCPRCLHPISKRLVMTSYLVRPVGIEEEPGTPAHRPSRPPVPPGTVMVFCDCNVQHADGKSGCGFYVKGVAGPGGA